MAEKDFYRDVDALVLGAGPAGMACCFELFKAKKNFVLVEKDNQVGGLSKTYRFGDFLSDNGPHRFFSKNSQLYDLMAELLGENWIPVDRFTRFYVDGKFFKYPVEWRDALTKLGPIRAVRVFLDYVLAQILYMGKPLRNFDDYAVSTFGRSLAEFNILNYTEKIWGIPCSELSVDWARQRIKDLTISSLIVNMLFKSAGPKTLVDRFYYPTYGTGMIYESIQKKVEAENKVLLNTRPTKILWDKKKIKEIHLSNREGIKPPWVVSSIPIPSFLELFEPKPPSAVLEAASKLRYRSQVYLFLTLDKESVFRDQWVYFPDQRVPFGRISEMKNFSDKMSPAGKTSLFVEYFCWMGDEVWGMAKKNLTDLTVSWLVKLGFIDADEVLESYHVKKKYAYPVYTLDYSRNLSVVKDFFEGFSNLIYTGRQGRFKYTNQDHSLEMGILAARTLIEGRKYDLDVVGDKQEYFEKGYA